MRKVYDCVDLLTLHEAVATLEADSVPLPGQPKRGSGLPLPCEAGGRGPGGGGSQGVHRQPVEPRPPFVPPSPDTQSAAMRSRSAACAAFSCSARHIRGGEKGSESIRTPTAS